MDFEQGILASIMEERGFELSSPMGDFESHGNDRNGRWSARWLMAWLGYESYAAFQKAIGRAMQTCSTMEFSIAEHFKPLQTTIDGATSEDYDLTRFACYLTAMNGDPRKPEVAAAQVHFAGMAEAVRLLATDPDNVHRIRLRDELSQNEKTLSGVAKSAGVLAEKYGLFHNAGYMGMYNMSYNKLKEYKGFQGSGSLLDFMGRQELAAHQFRVTQTEAMIKNENLRGQHALERAAQKVGREVRETMIRTSGTHPENLPLAEDIKKVRTKLKRANKELQKLDAPQKKP
jgi:DNA-damage-inducible protein D